MDERDLSPTSQSMMEKRQMCTEELDLTTGIRTINKVQEKFRNLTNFNETIPVRN